MIYEIVGTKRVATAMEANSLEEAVLKFHKDNDHCQIASVVKCNWNDEVIRRFDVVGICAGCNRELFSRDEYADFPEGLKMCSGCVE